MEKLKQRLIVDTTDAINGFSPSFVRVLLEKLKELRGGKGKNGLYRNRATDFLSPITEAIVCHLRSQIYCADRIYRRSVIPLDEINEIIEVAEKFLTLFEAPEKSKLISVLDSKTIEEIPNTEELVKEFSKFGEKGILEEHKGGFRADLSPCHQAPIEITEGGLRQEICSKCREPIRETRFKE